MSSKNTTRNVKELRKTPRLDLPRGTWVVLKVESPDHGLLIMEGELIDMSAGGFGVRVANVRENLLPEGLRCQVLVKPATFDDETNFGEVMVRRQITQDEQFLIYGIQGTDPDDDEDPALD
ncbi:MAG: PilZ domain-containing protein [Planctomycetota bacterium]